LFAITGHLGFVWRVREGRGLEKKKKEGTSRRNRYIEKRRLWGFIFLHNTKSFFIWRNSKIVLQEGFFFGGVWRVYKNSSNLIYVVMIFLKLKIY